MRAALDVFAGFYTTFHFNAMKGFTAWDCLIKSALGAGMVILIIVVLSVMVREDFSPEIMFNILEKNCVELLRLCRREFHMHG